MLALAEMGDKTQLLALTLASRYRRPWESQRDAAGEHARGDRARHAHADRVTVGTTLGMLAAKGLAVFGGAALAARLPMHYLRWSAATLFGLFGALTLASAFRGA